MSKNTAKQRVIQLKEWLKLRKSTDTKTGEPKKFSKSDHYSKTRKRYGSKKSY